MKKSLIRLSISGIICIVFILYAGLSGLSICIAEVEGAAIDEKYLDVEMDGTDVKTLGVGIEMMQDGAGISVKYWFRKSKAFDITFSREISRYNLPIPVFYSRLGNRRTFVEVILRGNPCLPPSPDMCRLKHKKCLTALLACFLKL